MTIWRLKTHHISIDSRLAAYEWTKSSRQIAIGWGKIGDLRSGNFNSGSDIKSAIAAAYPESSGSNNINGGRSLWNFWKVAREGDLIILAPTARKPPVMKIIGPLEYDATSLIWNGEELDGEYFFRREVEPTSYNPNDLWKAGGATRAPNSGIYDTFYPLAKQI